MFLHIISHARIHSSYGSWSRILQYEEIMLMTKERMIQLKDDFKRQVTVSTFRPSAIHAIFRQTQSYLELYKNIYKIQLLCNWVFLTEQNKPETPSLKLQAPNLKFTSGIASELLWLVEQECVFRHPFLAGEGRSRREGKLSSYATKYGGCFACRVSFWVAL